MPNISVEQQFPDPAYVLNLVLSALGQDPQHDFYEGFVKTSENSEIS